MGEILVVEDNPDNAMLAKKILEHYGYQVDIAENGIVALGKCQKKKYQLVFAVLLQDRSSSLPIAPSAIGHVIRIAYASILMWLAASSPVNIHDDTIYSFPASRS